MAAIIIHDGCHGNNSFIMSEYYDFHAKNFKRTRTLMGVSHLLMRLPRIPALLMLFRQGIVSILTLQ